MASRRSDEERDALAKALAGVKPLAPRAARARPARARAPAVRHPHDGDTGGDAPVAAAAAFALETSGERIEGLVHGIDRAWLRRLRAGEITPETRVDLHGLSAREAERLLRRTLAAAHDAGRRCVLVVHGRGLRSAEGAVLRAALPQWLADPRTAPRVMAFASARPRDGGTGATYVLLRRPR